MFEVTDAVYTALGDDVARFAPTTLPAPDRRCRPDVARGRALSRR